jgi:hypothetical protein
LEVGRNSTLSAGVASMNQPWPAASVSRVMVASVPERVVWARLAFGRSVNTRLLSAIKLKSLGVEAIR